MRRQEKSAPKEGGSEGIAREQQYQYRNQANLVIHSERQRGPAEPTGEVESLRGKALPRMGDRASVARPKDLDDKLEKRRKRAADKAKSGASGDKSARRVDRHEPMNVLQATEALDTSGYAPKTRETRDAYEKILSFIQPTLGDVSTDILKSCADEVLATLKDDTKKDNDRKKLIEETISAPLTNENFAKLTSLGKLITDYTDDSAANLTGEGLDEEHGVAVVFGEDAEDGSDADDDDDDDEAAEREEAEAEASGIAAREQDEEMAEAGLDPRAIDGFWLQRELSKHFPDPLRSQKLAADVLQAMRAAPDDEVENALVQLLDYERFELVKLLLTNRWKVVYCTLLGQVQDVREREVIEAEMSERPEGRAVLAALKGTAPSEAKTEAIQKSIRREARALSEGARKEAVSGADASKGRQMLDLDALGFVQGAHLMSNKQCKLPPGSFRVQKKGFEEVHVPALKTPAFAADEKLVTLGEMPAWAQPAFAHVKNLNRVQSRLYKHALFSPDNLLLCAPTGAGKTNVALLCMLHEIGLHRLEDGTIDRDAFKIIYIAPMKSLVQEMVGSFSQRLAPYGIVVKELTGDQNLTKQQIGETQLIITTPEKWDIITRKTGDRTYTQLVRLVILDEVHLLHDDRGPVLESIVARTIRQIEATQEAVRLVGLSATLPNYEDVATFLRVKPSGLFTFDNSFRPCPLEQTYIGVTEKKGAKRLQMMMEITYEKVMEQAGKSQVLIFTHSRKDTAKTAKALRDMCLANDTLAKILREDAVSRSILQEEQASVKNADLKDLLPYGFAVHHAGMQRSDRTLVEELFADKHIQVLVSTATLAWGVNLPAHTVIIKGTQIYSPEKGRWTELSPLDVMQMLGRAGRPAYDTSGEGIVITTHQELQFYLSLLNHQLPIESQFVSRLPDQLNAEIVLGTVANLDEAVTWLGYTYLYICMLRSPALYGISQEQLESDRLLERRRQDLIHTAATVLDKANLIKYDKRTGAFQVTDLGRVASHYYVTHGSMAVFNEHLKAQMSDIELFRLFSLSGEFKYINVREEEKQELERLLEKVPIPVKEAIEEPTAKVNVLLQAYISRLRLEGFALLADMVYVTQSAARIMRALFEIVLKRGWATLALRILNICKMVDRKMWQSQSPLRQFKAVPEEILKKLERRDFPFERLYDLSAAEIGEMIHAPSQGKAVHKLVHQFPKVELAAHVQPVTRSTLRIELTITPDFQYDEKVHGNAEPFWIWVEDCDGDVILHHEYFLLKQKFAEEEHLVTFTVPLFDPLPPHYFVRVVSDRWLGAGTQLPISFRHLILPEKYAPPTELLDLQATPLAAVKDDVFEAIYASQIRHLNPIQTQAFPAIFNSDDNVLLCAPTGSGKTLMAELAILRVLRKAGAEHPRIVYLAPKAELLTERMRDWSAKFAQYNLAVVQLTGETAADLKALERGNIIVSAPDKWDMLSRRWRQRKNVQAVNLLIVDELHLLGFEGGHVLEVVVSRMRYVASDSGNKIRILGLGSPIANAKDVGDWLGATSKSLFNFHPNVRPVPLEIHLQGFDIAHPSTRIMAMLKPTLSAVAHHGRGKPIIVLVPSRKEAVLVAKDLRIQAESPDVGGAVGKPAFMRCTADDLAPYQAQLKNRATRDLLAYGIGMYHELLPDAERAVLEKLFSADAIQVLIVTYPLVWSLPLRAHLLVVMSTQYYDGKEHGYVDYPITDVLQAMGCASRPGKDESAVCVILCHAPKKDFYKKFLYEPLPIESHLEHFLADHMNAEIVAKTITNKQYAVDWLTWTFVYRRYTQNPNYYNLQGVSHRHLSDHLSELVETTLGDLEKAKMIQIVQDMDVRPLNLGMIASYYNIKYTTVELFSSVLTAKTKMRGLIEVLSNASEYDAIAIRRHEANQLRKLAAHLPLKTDALKFTDPHAKANVLLQAHFSRRTLPADLTEDQARVLEQAPRLLQAIVDVISSNGWLTPALATMELSQMVTQAVWDADPVLKQLPHLSDDALKRLADAKVETIFDLIELSDDKRRDLLQLSNRQLADVARVCNAYPNIDLSYKLVQGQGGVSAGGPMSLQVELTREADEDEIAPVHAPHFPKEKQEGWWLVVGDVGANHLACIKRVTFGKTTKLKLDFAAPAAAGKQTYTLYLMCDSYTGCDQEYHFSFNVTEADPMAD